MTFFIAQKSRLISIFPKNISFVRIIITKQRSVWCSRDSRGIVICIWIKFYISGLKFQWNLGDGYLRMSVWFSRGRSAQRQGIGDAKTTDECRWTFRNQFALIFQDGICGYLLLIFDTRSMRLKTIIRISKYLLTLRFQKYYFFVICKWKKEHVRQIPTEWWSILFYYWYVNHNSKAALSYYILFYFWEKRQQTHN